MAETTEQYRNRINQIKTGIENEPYIKKMRENIAEGISKTGNRQADIEVRQDKLEDDFVKVQQDASAVSPSGAEVAVARGEYPNLDGRLTAEQNKVNAQLAETEAYLNQLQNIINQSVLMPYYVENMADFGWVGLGVPTGISKYPGGNYVLKITGNVGDDFVTVTDGNIEDAGTGKWAAVIKNDKGEWRTVAVTGSDGISKINVYPRLTEKITNGELGNLHDEIAGQHYTERGYFALAQHLYRAKPKYAERNKYLAKFKGSDTTGKWTRIGAPYLNYAYSTNIGATDVLTSYSSIKLSVLCYGGSEKQGIEWTENVSGKRGFFETFVGSDSDTLTAEFYLDGSLIKKIENFGKVVKRLVFDYANASTATFKIFTTPTANQRINISDTTWWINEKDNTDQIIPPHAKVVYLGDSWGENQGKAMTRELSRLITKDSYSTIEVINPSKGGMTSAWGLSWFEEYVIKKIPTHVFIEFFTNDLNTQTTTFIGPDGIEYPLSVSQMQWKVNVKKMVDLAIREGIQPIIVTPAPTSIISQTQRHADGNVYLVEGAQG